MLSTSCSCRILVSLGILWKKQGGSKAVEVDKSDILGVTWMKVPRTNQLGVRIKDGLYYKFAGFRDQNNCGITPEENQLSVSGHNWGEVDLNGNMLTFVTGSKQAFEVSLADESQTQLQGKNNVILEFHVDDTTRANECLLLLDCRVDKCVMASSGFQADVKALQKHLAARQFVKLSIFGEYDGTFVLSLNVSFTFFVS
ncbi:hypothetical protein J1N35_025253 [Gossypium stocksii]|uniref:Uncharacterized protein n=1 Tax=Gossypium stocksii TaxID=47602 RepID=A0A9D3V681_9ROSI|nr:hypothetical protein J1N35_025253 [Gossypium stocksii]